MRKSVTSLVCLLALLSSSLSSYAAVSLEDQQELKEVRMLTDKKEQIKRLDRYLQSHPKSAPVIGFRAQLHCGLAQSPESIRDANRYFELKPNPIEPYVYKARINSLLRTGRTEEALRDLDALRRLTQEDTDSMRLRALALNALGRSSEALEIASRAVKQNNIDALQIKAIAELNLNRVSDGVRDTVEFAKKTKNRDAVRDIVAVLCQRKEWQKVVIVGQALAQAKFTDRTVQAWIVEALFRLNRFPEALAACDKFKRLFGSDLHELKYNIYKGMGDSKSAAEEVNAMIKAAPKDKKLRLLRAKSLVKEQDFEEALSDYSFAGSLVEKDMDARAKRAECYFALGQYDTAAREFAVVNRTKADYNSLYLEAMSLKALAKYSEAVLCFTRAIAMKPLMVRLFAQRADCYFRMKDYAHSESDFDDAIALAPKNYSLYFARGLCRLGAGDAEGAVKDLTVCLADHNLHSVAYAARAKAYTKLGKNALAAQDLRASGSASKAVEGDLFKQ